MPFKPFVIALLVFAVPQTWASDTAKEARWASQIEDALLDGDPVWLSANQHEFLAIDTEDEDQSAKRALIVVHGVGVHPDWDQVIKPVRVEMSYRGWRTLSIQMPILANEATAMDYVPLFEELAPRFDAAISYLQEQGIEQIVIVAHSMGAAMSARYLADHPGAPIEAFIAVGMNAAQPSEKTNSANSLGKISIPVLDLYGSEDLPQVLSTVAKRAEAASHNPNYSQLEIAGADHFFDGESELLLAAIQSWLIQRGY